MTEPLSRPRTTTAYAGEDNRPTLDPGPTGTTASQSQDEPGSVVRRLVRTADRAALGTIDGSGGPYVSLVMLAVDHAAAPLLLLSDLADHTKNFRRDARVSLLVDGTHGMTSPLAGARATLTGRIERATDAQKRARYVARHPDAEGFAGFADFNLYTVRLERAHLVQGFGKIFRIEAAAVLFPGDAQLPLAAAEAELVAHMNDDHHDAVLLYATRLLGQPAGQWRLTGIDPEGADLACGQTRGRLWFDKPVHDDETARLELVRLAKRARQQPANNP